MVEVTIVPRVKTETATIHSPISKCGDNWWRDVEVRMPYKGVDTAYRTLPSLGDPSLIETFDADFLEDISANRERIREFSIKVAGVLSDRQRKNIDKMLRRAAQYVRDAKKIHSTWARGFHTTKLGKIPPWPFGGQPQGGINGNIEEGHARDGERYKQLVRAALRNVRCAEEVAKKGTIRDRNKNTYKGVHSSRGAVFGNLGLQTGGGEEPAPEPKTGGIPGAKDRATRAYLNNSAAIDTAIREYLDYAADQKNIAGGWVAASPTKLRRKVLPGQEHSGPAKGPQHWSQKEAWWAATRAFDDVFPDKSPYKSKSISQWAAGINPQFVVDDAYLMGMIMRKAMGMTGAETVQEGSTRPDWGLFVPARLPVQSEPEPEPELDDELEQGDIDLEDDFDDFDFPQDDHEFPEPPGFGSEGGIDLPRPDLDEEEESEVEEGPPPSPASTAPAKKTAKKKDNTLLIAGAAAVGLLAFSRK